MLFGWFCSFTELQYRLLLWNRYVQSAIAPRALASVLPLLVQARFWPLSCIREWLAGCPPLQRPLLAISPSAQVVVRNEPWMRIGFPFSHASVSRNPFDEGRLTGGDSHCPVPKCVLARILTCTSKGTMDLARGADKPNQFRCHRP